MTYLTADSHEHTFTVTIVCTDDVWDQVFPGIPSVAADDPGMTSTEEAEEAIRFVVGGLGIARTGQNLREMALVDTIVTRTGTG